MIDPLSDSLSEVELLDHMGDDLLVVNAARVSFNKHHNVLDASDERILKYMAAHNHWSPFAHPQFQFHFKMPIMVTREWYRHTIGLTRNEVSRRYVDYPPEFYLPKGLRARDKNVKQGSKNEVVATIRSELWKNRRDLYGAIRNQYEDEIDAGVAPEVAREVLPMAMYTEFYETGSLAAYSRICKLRIADDVLKETRLYAEAVSELITPICPKSWEVLRG